MIQLLLAIIYLSFISLGLPDCLLGAAWPTLHVEFGIPISSMGLISMIISGGTVISGLLCDRVSRKLGTGKLTAISVAMTAAALLGFSYSTSLWQLCLWAIPYGLGAGSVDAALNNYVALHYASRHMSWLHCMWGVGASLGPYVMSYALSGGQGWEMGYRYVGILQVVLTAVLFMSLPMWKNRKEALSPQLQTNSEEASAPAVEDKPLSLWQIVKIPGAKEVMLTFFGYCAVESSMGYWASSYLALGKGLSAEAAAANAGLFFLGLTIGRAISGFLTMKLTDAQMVRLGQGIIAFGLVWMFLPLGTGASLFGLVMMGLGCAPIYPCLIHSTPAHFGADKSQAIIGVQMASASTGNLITPPLFGLVANYVDIKLFPVYVLVFLALMIFMHESLLKKTA